MHHIDRIKKKIMSIDEEKEFGKIDLPIIYDKTSQQLLWPICFSCLEHCPICQRVMGLITG